MKMRLLSRTVLLLFGSAWVGLGCQGDEGSNDDGSSSGGAGAGQGGSAGSATGGAGNGASATGGSSAGCPAAQSDCAGRCVSLGDDNANCGSCGNVCSSGQTCGQGVCGCLAGLTACGASCVDVSSTGSHCGGCGMACPSGQACSNGTCGSCVAAQTTCGQDCVDVATNPQHCGGCNGACGAGLSCRAGVCSCATAGQSLCSGQCRSTASDAAHCGACGRACSAGQTCSGGICSGGGAGGAGATGGAGAVGGAGAGATGGVGATGATGGACTGDTCAFGTGVTWQCKKRFMYGVNYAWQSFGGDFGGYGNQRGVAQNTAAVSGRLGAMASNGVSVVRWWVWPDFRGNGVAFSGTTPTGLGGTALADLEAALTLANQHDVYLMLTLFSFDGFKTSAERANMSGFATDATRRAALVTNVIRPFARAAQASPNARRVIAWDVINEPEWSVTGSSLYGGDPAFDPQDNMQTVSHAQMETLLRDVIVGLRAESRALVTVGAAAMKWKNAWSRLDLDFYQFHIYDWVHQGGWPYNRTPTQYGVAGKPVVMGEFPPAGLSAASYRTMIDYWYGNGYAGALAWQDSTYVVNWPNVKSFADAHACESSY